MVGRNGRFELIACVRSQAERQSMLRQVYHLATAGVVTCASATVSLAPASAAPTRSKADPHREPAARIVRSVIRPSPELGSRRRGTGGLEASGRIARRAPRRSSSRTSPILTPWAAKRRGGRHRAASMSSSAWAPETAIFASTTSKRRHSSSSFRITEVPGPLRGPCARTV